MQSLDRLLRILEAVSEGSRPCSVVEVTEKVGLSISTVSRLMKQLAEEEMLHRDEDERRYSLGPRLIALAHTAEAHLDMNAIVKPVLERLRDASGETTSLHVLRGRQRVCLIEVPGRHEVRRVVPVGVAHDLDGGATAGVLLAGFADDELDRRLAGLDLRRSSEAELRETIAHVEREGYALAVDNWVSGLCGVSAAVRRGGAVFAAISLSGPSTRFTERVARTFIPDILAGAAEISARIGGDARVDQLDTAQSR